MFYFIICTGKTYLKLLYRIHRCCIILIHDPLTAVVKYLRCCHTITTKVYGYLFPHPQLRIIRWKVFRCKQKQFLIYAYAGTALSPQYLYSERFGFTFIVTIPTCIGDALNRPDVTWKIVNSQIQPGEFWGTLPRTSFGYMCICYIFCTENVASSYHLFAGDCFLLLIVVDVIRFPSWKITDRHYVIVGVKWQFVRGSFGIALLVKKRRVNAHVPGVKSLAKNFCERFRGQLCAIIGIYHFGTDAADI